MTPRELRHSFVSVLSDASIPVDQIAQPVAPPGRSGRRAGLLARAPASEPGRGYVKDQLFTRTPERSGLDR